MENVAIRVENLSKQYRIGGKIQTYNTLRDRLNDMVQSRIQSARALFSQQPRPHRPGQSETFWALRDVSFDIARGEVIGIIGKNGSGKSTLLKILSRITEPTEGHAQIRGRVGSLLEVGTGFHQELSGRENIYLNGAILGMTRQEIDRKFDEMVDFAEVEEFIDTPVKRYSSGMYLRLAFAVAAHLEPEILLVDEVLAVGDAAFQQKCLAQMDQVGQEGRTVLFVSHNMSAISSLTQRTIYLQNGQMVSFEPTADAISRYIATLHADVTDGGYFDFRAAKHTAGTRSTGELLWAELYNEAGNRTAVFAEGEPVNIKLCFQIHKPVDTVQFGCTFVRAAPEVTLFTIASPEYRKPFQPGCYSATTTLIPNPLRDGIYAISPKLFINGQRQDGIRDGISFRMIDQTGAASQRWMAGLISVDYQWKGLTALDENESSAQ